MLSALTLALMLPFSPGSSKMARIFPPGDNTLQHDLNRLYATIDAEIKSAKALGKRALIVKMEDPEFSDKGFSEGMRVLMVVLQDHYTNLGYKVSLSTLDNFAYLRISWAIQA